MGSDTSSRLPNRLPLNTGWLGGTTGRNRRVWMSLTPIKLFMPITQPFPQNQDYRHEESNLNLPPPKSSSPYNPQSTRRRTLQTTTPSHRPPPVTNAHSTHGRSRMLIRKRQNVRMGRQLVPVAPIAIASSGPAKVRWDGGIGGEGGCGERGGGWRVGGCFTC